MTCATSEILVVHHRQPKQRNYIAGLALDALEQPGEARWRFYLGRELFYSGHYRSAIAVLEGVVALAGVSRDECAQSLSVIGECCEQLKDLTSAEAAYERAIACGGSQREPWLRLARLRSHRGHFAGAVECVERALSIDAPPHAPERDENYSWIPHELLYWNLFWLGRHETALRHWETCRALCPDDETIRAHGRLFGSPSNSRSAMLSPFTGRRVGGYVE